MSEKDFTKLPPGTGLNDRVRIEVVLGYNLQSFKNKKRSAIIERPGGGQIAVPMTEKKVKSRMKAITESIATALCFAFQSKRAAGVIPMGCSLQSWIASCVPLDDSAGWLPESDGYRIEWVEPGNEGFVIEFEKIEEGAKILSEMR